MSLSAVILYESSGILTAKLIITEPTGLAILKKQRRPVAQRALNTFHIEAT